MESFFKCTPYINVQCLYFYGALQQFVSEMVNKEKFFFVIFVFTHSQISRYNHIICIHIFSRKSTLTVQSFMRTTPKIYSGESCKLPSCTVPKYNKIQPLLKLQSNVNGLRWDSRLSGKYNWDYICFWTRQKVGNFCTKTDSNHS